MSCLFGTQYVHTADVLSPTIIDNKITGKKVKSWVFDDTLKCYATVTSRGSISGATGEQFSTLYERYSKIRIVSPTKVNVTWRITNICYDDEPIWTEENGDPTVFDVTGYIPVFDIFGSVIAYEMLCERSSEQ